MDHPEPFVYRYNPDESFSPVMDKGERVWIADSFLVDSGMARAPALHAARFSASGHALFRLSPEKLERFWRQAVRHVPREGLWFPRIEIAGSLNNPLLRIRIRPAPPLKTEARLAHGDTRDSRTRPRHKGPDMTMLDAKRQQVLAMGADEGFLCTPSGYLLEGFFSAIMWWEGDTLCQTPPSRRVLPSITATLLRETAARRHIPFAWRFRRWHELNGCDTWTVNALHGIRRVVNWTFAPWQTTTLVDRDDWQLALNHYAMQPVYF